MPLGRLLVTCSVVFSFLCEGGGTEEEEAGSLFPGYDAASSRMKSLLQSKGIVSEGLKLSELQETAENSTDASQPHAYVLSVWSVMMNERRIDQRPQKEPSVVAVLTEPTTDDVPRLKDLMLTFSLNKSLSKSLESVTAAEIVLYKNSKLRTRLSVSDTVMIIITVYNANDSQYNSNYTQELASESDKVLVFSVTEVFRALVEEKSSVMRVVLSLETPLPENQTTLSLRDCLVTDDPKQGPLLIVYHNMVPLDPTDRPSSISPTGRSAYNDGDQLYIENISNSSEMLDDGTSANNGSAHRMRRKARAYRTRSTVIQDNSGNCHLHSWVVDFHADLRWTWIKFPTTVKLNFCAGVCPSPLAGKDLNSTNNAFIRDQYIMATKWQHREIPPTSCVPIKLAPIDVYYVTANNDHVIRRLPDVVTEDCACL